MQCDKTRPVLTLQGRSYMYCSHLLRTWSNSYIELHVIVEIFYRKLILKFRVVCALYGSICTHCPQGMKFQTERCRNLLYQPLEGRRYDLLNY